MASLFLPEDSLLDAWGESQSYMRPLFEPFDEYERIARNKPYPGIAPHLPKVTEGTLSSTIIKQPRRIIQQLPTGKIVCKEDPDLADIIQYVLVEDILKNATTNGSVLQKSWALTQKALTYGSQPAYIFFTQNGEYIGADFSLPYIKDIFLENGQLCSGDANFMFMRAWYTPSQIDAIIAREKKLMKAAEERGEKYKSSWDLKLLEKSKTEKKEKPADAQSPTEREKGVGGGIEIIHAFQKGIGAEFYSFLPGGDSKGKILRRKENPDFRGKIPIEYMYHTVDMSNPLGRGAVEHSGGAQNLLDGVLQSFQYTQALSVSPPMKKWGSSIVESSIVMQPDVIWDMGSDANSKIEPLNINNQAIANFPENFGLIKSIIINGTNGMDTSISSESGNPGFSKTSAGVKQQQSVLGVDDNYIRKQFETAYGEILETMLNIHFAEHSGRKELIVEGEQLEKLSQKFPELNENGGNLSLVYDRVKTALSFNVDPGTSGGDDDSEQTEILTNLIDMSEKYPTLIERAEEEGYQVNIGELFARLVKKSGVENSEKIIRKLSEEEQIAKKEEEQAASDADRQALAEQGFSDDQIELILQRFSEGIAPEEVMNELGVGV